MTNLDKIKQLQKNCFLKGIKLKVFAIFSKPGTGKTKMAQDLIMPRFLEDKVDKVVWICPKNIINNTIAEFEKFLPILLEKIIFVNTEKFSRIKYQELLDLNINKKTFLVCDESIFIKNINSKRTRNLLLLSQNAIYKIILNGTPFTKNPLGLYAQMNFLDKRILQYKDYWDFCKKHFEYYKNMPWKILKVHNWDYLMKQIEPFIYDADLDLDILEKPEKNIFCSFKDPDFLKEYNRWENNYLESIKNIISNFKKYGYSENSYMSNDKKEVLKSLSKMYYYSSLNIKKIDEMNKILHELQNQQVIIFCRFVANVWTIKNELKEKAIVFCGEHKDDIEIFKQGKVQYLIITLGTGSVGLNLQNSNNIIFYDRSFDNALMIQAKRRIYRMGQTNDCNYFVIKTLCSFEALMDNNLEYKNNMLISFTKELNKITGKNIINELKKEGVSE